MLNPREQNLSVLRAGRVLELVDSSVRKVGFLGSLYADAISNRHCLILQPNLITKLLVKTARSAGGK
jgi:hypothetical protein